MLTEQKKSSLGEAVSQPGGSSSSSSSSAGSGRAVDCHSAAAVRRKDSSNNVADSNYRPTDSSSVSLKQQKRTSLLNGIISNGGVRKDMVNAGQKSYIKSGNAIRRPLETSLLNNITSNGGSSSSNGSGGGKVRCNSDSSQVHYMNEPLQGPAIHRRNESDSRIGLLRRQHTDVAIARRSHLFSRSSSILGNETKPSQTAEPVLLTNFVSVADRGGASLRRQSSLDSDLHLSSYDSTTGEDGGPVAPETPSSFLHRRYLPNASSPQLPPLLQVLVFVAQPLCLYCDCSVRAYGALRAFT